MNAAKGCIAIVAPACARENQRRRMMHVTGDGKRMYVTNSLLSTLDRSW
jgi:hypothetical protein